jgi:hypothetical protein
VLDQPCKFHSILGREVTHSTRQCNFIKELEQRAQQFPRSLPVHPAEGQEDHQCEPAAEQLDQGDDNSPAIVEQYHIFTTPEKDKKSDLWYEAEVNVVMPSEPQYMQWPKAAITWGCEDHREDHSPLMPSPGEYTLVLDPIMHSDMHTCHFSRVLIDGGSSINLLYRIFMEKLGIPVAQFKPSWLTFHGVMPGHL